MRKLTVIGSLICALTLSGVAISAEQAQPQESAASEQPAKPEQPADQPEASEKATVAIIVIKGSVPEGPGQPGLFGELEQRLDELIKRLERAAKDDKIQAVLLRLRNPTIGHGKVEELRAAIARTRAAGKKVYAEMRSGTTADYLLACACDQIIMPESGVLMIPGVRAEVMFFKDLLDKVGIEADFQQIGKFKGAAEPMTRTGMSAEFRQQYDLLVGDIYDRLIETIATDRKLPKEKVIQLVDDGLITPAEALQAGLIDVVAYEEEMGQHIKKDLNTKKLMAIRNYAKKKLETDFSGMMGFVKLLEMMMGVSPTKRASREKKIAVIYAVGPILSGKGGPTLFGGETVGDETIIKALKTAGDDKTVAAIVLRVDSPGGSALASDLIWKKIQQVRKKKPVIASMGDTAASGGYYIAMGCDKIYAEPGTVTGSIGVVGGKLAMGKLFDKVGVKTEVISRGRNSGLLSIDKPFTDSERVVWKKMLQRTYDQFTAKAAQGRKMKADQLESLAQGRIWSGSRAKENGLVDELGTLHDVIAAAKKLGGVAEDEKTELLILPKPQSFFDQLFGAGDATTGIKRTVDAVAPGASKHLGEIETIRALFAEPSVLILPYQVEIR